MNLILALMTVFGVIPIKTALAGFSNPGLITVVSELIPLK
jgi:hypothetical protein